MAHTTALKTMESKLAKVAGIGVELTLVGSDDLRTNWSVMIEGEEVPAAAKLRDFLKAGGADVTDLFHDAGSEATFLYFVTPA